MDHVTLSIACIFVGLIALLAVRSASFLKTRARTAMPTPRESFGFMPGILDQGVGGQARPDVRRLRG